MTQETHRGMWGALRPAIRRTSAEELLHARRTEIKASEPAPYTGAFGRIAADVPTVAEELDLPTGSVPVVPARSKLREQGVGTRVRTRTNVSTGFVPLVRDSKTTPKNPTLSDLNRETMQKAAEAEAVAVAEAKNAVEAQTIDTAEAASASTAGRKYRTETTRGRHPALPQAPRNPHRAHSTADRTHDCDPHRSLRPFPLV